MFSQTTEYALRAMAWLALSPGTMVPTTTLAEKTRVPTHYLSKVLQQLAAENLIRGRRGVRGGYCLARPAADITLLHVVRAVAEVKRITSCPLGLETHSGELCPLHKRIDAAAQRVIELYESVSLQSLVEDPGQVRPLCERQSSARLTVSASAKR